MISTPRAMTAGELTLQRSANQSSKKYVLVDVAPVVWQAQINQSFTSYERINTLTWDNGSGTRTDVLADQTLYVGSTPGAWDVAILRVRATPGASTVQIGEVSNIKFADGQYLTVVDDFQVWTKTRSESYCDSNLAYSDQHANFYPVPIIDPDMVFFSNGSPLAVTFNAQNSWCPGAGTKTYAWSFPGANSSSGTTTSTPTATYNTPGRYRFGCAVTVNSKTTTRYGYIHYVGDGYNPLVDAAFDEPSGTDAWEFEISVWSANFQPYARCYLVSRDYYAGHEAYIAYNSNHQYVKVAGRLVRSDSSARASKVGPAQFRVYGPAWFMSRQENTGREYKNVTTTPAGWNEYEDMTIDQCLDDFARWQTTLTTTCNVYRSGNDLLAPSFSVGSDNLHGQLSEIGKRILAVPRFDRFGDLYFGTLPNLIPVADRTWATVLTLSANDWMGEIEINSLEQQTSQVLVTGVKVSISGAKTYYYSIAGGRTLDRFGTSRMPTDLLAATQAAANEQAALLLASENTRWEFIIHLAGNNWLVDPAYNQFISATITYNGETIYSGNLIVRQVDARVQGTAWVMDWYCVPETFPGPAVKGDTPISETPPIPKPPNPKPPVISTGLPGTEPEPGTVPDKIFGAADGFLPNVGVFYTENYNDDEPDWKWMNEGIDPLGYITGLCATVTGALWCQVGNNIYYAPYLGSRWYPIVDADWLEAAGESYILGYGVNPYNGQVIVKASSKFWTGDQNGITNAGAAWPYLGGGYSRLVWGGGKWRMLSTWGYYLTPNTYHTISADGGTIISVDELPLLVNGYAKQISSPKYVYFQGGPWPYANDVYRIENNDASTLTEVAAGLNIVEMASSPDGSTLLGNFGTGPQRSTDWGATWQSLPLTLGGYRSFLYVDSKVYLSIKRAGSMQEVSFTTDSGANWTVREGNINSLGAYNVYDLGWML